tara:strand:+ start:7759 stop:8502 length:744 start_codon:yes stop_codon:yes gene_type:complete
MTIYKYLNKEDEYDLIKKYQDTLDEKYMEELIIFNMLNIKMLVHKFKSSFTQVDLKDAEQEATIAMMMAIRTFDLSKGNRLISLATTIINNALIKYSYVCNRTIRVPETAIRRFKLIERHNITEPVPKLGISQKTIDLHNTYNYIPYDVTLLSREDEPEASYYDDDDEYLQIVNKLLHKLKEKERLVIEHRFELNGKDKLSHLELCAMLMELGLIKSTIPHKSVTGTILGRAMIKLRKFAKQDNITL